MATIDNTTSRVISELIFESREGFDFIQDEISGSSIVGGNILELSKENLGTGILKFTNSFDRTVENVAYNEAEKEYINPGNISANFTMSKSEYMLLSLGSNPFSKDIEKYDKKVQELANRASKKIKQTIEARLSQLLTTGKFTPSDTGATEVDFEVPETNTPSTAVNWGTNEDIPSLLTSWKEKATIGDAVADTVLLGSNAASKLLKNKAIKEILDRSKYQLGELKFREKRRGVIFLGEYYGLEIYHYSGSYVNSSNEVTNFIPNNKVVVCSKKESLRHSFMSTGRTDAPEDVKVFSRIVEDEKEGKISLVVATAPAIYLQYPSSLFIANIAA